MILLGFLLGVAVGATPGLAGPMAMAISLPILISIFGFSSDALLPVMSFLIGIMKGATIGGAVPAILFNTPGTPDAYMTTLDGYPLAQKGQANKALRVAHFSSAAGDTFSDVVLILGEVFRSLEDLWHHTRSGEKPVVVPQSGDQKLHWADIRRLLPFISRSAMIGTVIGALPSIGSTLAATLGYTSGAAMHARRGGSPTFGEGAPEGIAATEAANSPVSGANLIPVLSLGIPGNAVAVFLILAADTIGGFNPGPSVFRFSSETVNPELVIAFGLFTAMMLANLLNWTIGGAFMRSMGFMSRIPKHILLPIVLLVTLTSIYVQETRMAAIWFTVGFGVLGYVMRRLGISPLPFVIAFILGGKLEESARQAFAATGSDAWFLFSSPVAAIFMALAVITVVLSLKKTRGSRP